MSFVFREHPDFSWSFSRSKMIRECLMKYFINYYLSHNGWYWDAPLEKRRAYVLKNLTSLPLLTGNIIHDFIENNLNALISKGISISPESIEKSAFDILRDAYKQSLGQKNRFLEQPKKVTMLSEIYYGGMPSDQTVEKTKKKIKNSAVNFLRSKTLREIRKYQNYTIQSKIDPFTYKDIVIYAIPDVFYTTDNAFVITDWKSGNPAEDDQLQLMIYSLFAVHLLGIKKKIIGRLEYLASGEVDEIEVTQENIQRAENLIVDSVSEMRSKEILVDPELNIAYDMKYYRMPSCANCSSCNFKEICLGMG